MVPNARLDALADAETRYRVNMVQVLSWKTQPIHESEMALFSECMRKCARKVLDTADIVREGDFSPVIPISDSARWPMPCWNSEFVCADNSRLTKPFLQHDGIAAALGKRSDQRLGMGDNNDL